MIRPGWSPWHQMRLYMVLFYGLTHTLTLPSGCSAKCSLEESPNSARNSLPAFESTFVPFRMGKKLEVMLKVSLLQRTNAAEIAHQRPRKPFRQITNLPSEFIFSCLEHSNCFTDESLNSNVDERFAKSAPGQPPPRRWWDDTIRLIGRFALRH